jgi:putative ABC transport system ATP-binding protein
VTSGALRIAGLRSALAGPFDLEAAPGEAIAVTGPSGSGKSLFLRMVADLDPNEGNVALGGRNRHAMPAPDWRRLATYVAAESGWWEESVAAHFAPADRTPAAALAERLGLKPALMEGPVLRLSTGEKQRLALIRAFVRTTPALLLDEPTGPLDPESVERVETLLRERLAAGMILLLVTHDPAQAERLGARHLHMEAGRLLPA